MIPTWIKSLSTEQELLLHFPYTGNSVYAKFVHYLVDDYYDSGIVIKYDRNGTEVEDTLYYHDYKSDPDSYNNWIAYEVDSK